MRPQILEVYFLELHHLKMRKLTDSFNTGAECLETGHLLEGMGLVQMGWGSHLFVPSKMGGCIKVCSIFVGSSNFLSKKKKTTTLKE